ncbi:MAG TPA: hypothetical protein VKO20_00290, partial [Desulfosalsimonadaceae bacterium]|nr:hypothetical protein [Desulfosalsimonadaceae bacterium]
GLLGLLGLLGLRSLPPACRDAEETVPRVPDGLRFFLLPGVLAKPPFVWGSGENGRQLWLPLLP